jgi:hypothetical protein
MNDAPKVMKPGSMINVKFRRDGATQTFLVGDIEIMNWGPRSMVVTALSHDAVKVEVER